ncbi:MAG TPA: T9SS type A sorting domain-containing protein [Ignavibacteriaceae bacterium]|nr:T9SS type A sorting domain-containing protein [Ignavibacteriaceae bacterium]
MFIKNTFRKVVPLLILTILFFLLANNNNFAQSEQIRILTYNLLDYNSGARDTAFQTIFSSISPDPDIIAACEINDHDSVEAFKFLNNVLNSSGTFYSMGTFLPDIEQNGTIHSDANVIYYKLSKFTFLSSKLIIADGDGLDPFANHPSYEFQLYNNLTGNKIYIFGIHFPSNGADVRNSTANIVRSYSDALPSGSYFIAAGDFNFTVGGSESGYTTLLSSTSGSGYFLDPLSLSGSWSSNNYEYQTFSSRSTAFGGGSGGGLNYRYDLILNSQSIVNDGGIKYFGNYTTYGNDGLHHSLSINAIGSTGDPNHVVSQEVADALYSASDHLPVFADYTFEIPSTINPPYPGSIVFTQVGVDDGSGNNFIEFMTLYRMDLTSLKISSNPVQSTGQIDDGNFFDLNNTTWTDVPAGTFVRLGANLSNDDNATDRILQYNGSGDPRPTLASGSNQLIAYTGSATTPTYYIAGIHWGDTGGWTSSSNAPFDTPSSSNIALKSPAANNWHYNSTVDGNLYTTRNSLTNSGNWSSGTGYLDLTSSIGTGALPVELTSFTARENGNKIELKWRTETEVNNFGFEVQRSTDKISWDKIGFVPGNGNSNTPKDYLFTDKLIPNGSLYYRLKQEDVDGKFEYSSIIGITYSVLSKAILSQNYPNPFNPTSTIEYSIPGNSLVTLKIYDVLGREVVTLVNEKQNAGMHSVNFNGERLASGIYFYVLTAGNSVISKKMNLLK